MGQVNKFAIGGVAVLAQRGESAKFALLLRGLHTHITIIAHFEYEWCKGWLFYVILFLSSFLLKMTHVFLLETKRTQDQNLCSLHTQSICCQMEERGEKQAHLNPVLFWLCL